MSVVTSNKLKKNHKKGRKGGDVEVGGIRGEELRREPPGKVDLGVEGWEQCC